MRFRLLSLLFVLAGLLLLAPAAAALQDDGDAEEKDEGLPLAASETLSFTVTEGTWMSLDVSPDGQTIVFELLGDLYTLPITGAPRPGSWETSPSRASRSSPPTGARSRS